MKVKRNHLFFGFGSFGVFLSSGFTFRSLFSKNESKQELDDKYICLNQAYYEIPEPENLYGRKHLQSIPAHLSLLKLAKSRDTHIANYAIAKLANSQHLSDGQCREIAQMCDFDLTIKLSRTESVDPRIFLPPICTHLRMLNSSDSKSKSSRDLVFELLKKLHDSIQNANECTKYFASFALKANQISIAFESEMQHMDLVPEHIRKKNFMSEEKIDWFCLEALMGYSSSGQKACEMLINGGIFLILHTFRESYPNDSVMNEKVAKFLAKLSEYPESHKHFVATGWIGVLAKWLNDSENIELSFPAAKCLYNLDKDTQHVFTESVYLLNPFYRLKSTDWDIIFVHGLLGGIFRTWRQSDSSKNLDNYTRCWPQTWLAADIPSLRVLAIDYPTYLTGWKVECPTEKLSLKDRSNSILESLIAAGVGKRPIIWVGHSMGGLIIKEMLVSCDKSNSQALKDVIANTKGTVFYSCPNRGSDLAVWPSKFPNVVLPSTEVMELMTDSPALMKLHEEFLNTVRQRDVKCLSFGESFKSRLGLKKVKFSAFMVSEKSANPGYGEFHLLPMDHHSTCKPANKQSDAYRLTYDFILNLMYNNNFNYSQ
ncbi:protein SERAC1-like isoform X2 [Dinothrombium tinctorium]|uniref:Protein SERAC1 n=1 Tax=Dinothrombium tinctorium TaxID=1965070 RepID=A0A3S3PF48_9ACAR|nr:protein SERAC1-like isoform X2 [Dinothrombium tinctorium]